MTSRTGTAHKVGSKRSLEDVDHRIVVALAERDEASKKVSLLVYWQDRLARINADLDLLISVKQRLSGQIPLPSPLPASPGLPGPAYSGGPSLTIPYSHTAIIPNNITSEPRQANPLPSGANVAGEVEGEGGFS